MNAFFRTTAVAVAFFATGVAQASTVFDPVGDFSPGYTGAAADLDVTSFSVNYDGVANIFTLGGTMAGAINPATAGVYIIGVNTGSGVLAPFASIGAPDVRFNQVVRVNKDGTASVGTNAVTASIAGNAFSIAVSGTLFPTTGSAVRDYSWNLWPRNGVVAGTVVTDFSPDNAMLAAVPEPTTWAMMLLGMGAVGAALRRRVAPAVRFA